jgi:hypothetical protein
MDLKDFIKTTLSSIYNGVTETNKELIGDELGNTKEAHFVITPNEQDSLIEFDVALTIASNSSKKKGLSVQVYVANVDGGKVVKDSSQTVSRVKFKIKAHHYIG